MILTPSQIFENLKAAAQDRDLTAADLKLLIFVTVNRRDGATGDAYCSDAYIAEHTGLSRTAIKRSRHKLIDRGYIKTKPGSVNRHSTVYTPIRRQGPKMDPVPGTLLGELKEGGPTLDPVRSNLGPSQGPTLDPVKPRQGPTMDPVDQSIYWGKVPIKDDTPQRQYWDAFLIKRTGKPAPRSHRGVWNFRTEWPEETLQ